MGGDTGPHLCLSQEDSLQHIKTWVDRNVLSGSHMMAAPDLDSLAAIVPGHRRIIEVGCYCGALTRLFSLFGERVWSVDWLIGDEAAGHYNTDEVEAIYRENNADALESGRVELLKMSSTEGAAELARRGVTADLIWIDAGYEYPDVHADISNYLPLLAPGGVMCGHDAGAFEGVTQAVDELLPGALYYPQTVWVWRPGLPDLGPDYRVSFEVHQVMTRQAMITVGTR